MFGDLYGNVWEVDPLTGISRYGTGVPLFTASVVEHPIGAAPAVYSDGSHQFAAFATGGYVDLTDTGTSSTLWTGTTQMVFAVNLSANAGSLNELSQSTTSGVPNIAFHQNLASGQFAFAQLAVIGGQLFVTTDSSDVNASGYGLHGATGQAMAITTGALGALVSVTTGVSNPRRRGGGRVQRHEGVRVEQLGRPRARDGRDVDGGSGRRAGEPRDGHAAAVPSNGVMTNQEFVPRSKGRP